MTQLDLFDSEKVIKRKALLKKLEELKRKRKKKKRIKGLKL